MISHLLLGPELQNSDQAQQVFPGSWCAKIIDERAEPNAPLPLNASLHDGRKLQKDADYDVFRQSRGIIDRLKPCLVWHKRRGGSLQGPAELEKSNQSHAQIIDLMLSFDLLVMQSPPACQQVVPDANHGVRRSHQPSTLDAGNLHSIGDRFGEGGPPTLIG